MSLHANISPEAVAKLAAQKRNSTITSVIIALLLCALLGLILWIISLTPLFKNNEETVSYSTNSSNEQEITKPEMTDQVEKKPSAPSANLSKVIASTTPSPTAVPVPDITVTEPSLDFGNSDDFGDGWGSGGGGSGGGGGDFSFFKQKVKAKRVCYVIDYSGSMKGKKIELLKAELTKSIKALPLEIEYQLIFFAGPVWVAGDDVIRHDSGFTVKNKGEKYEWITKGGAHGYEPKDKKVRQKVEWITSSKLQIRKSLKAIKETKLIFGTIWNHPLEMALEMEPKPDVVFFMTDGSAGSSSKDVAKDIGRLAKKKGVIVNTIALMLPKAREAMGDLAKRTKGVFTMVDENGEATEQKVK